MEQLTEQEIKNENLKTYINTTFQTEVGKLVENYHSIKQAELDTMKANALGKYKTLDAMRFDLGLIEAKILDTKKTLKVDLSKKIKPKEIDKAKDEAKPTIDESVFTFKL